MCPTTIWDVDMTVNMMLSVAAHIAGYSTEWTALCTTIRKFRDYFYDNAAAFDIPLDKIAQLDGYIALFPILKFGVKALARDHNNLVDALYLVGELSNYANILYYRNDGIHALYLSPTLRGFYFAPCSGSLYPTTIRYQNPNHRWEMYYVTFSKTDKGMVEGWFLQNKHFNSARVRIKYHVHTGKSGETHISALFLNAGEPILGGGLTALERGDVNIVSQADFTYTTGILNYDTTKIVSLNTDITYIVVCCQDRFTDSYVWLEIEGLWVTPI